MGLRVEDEAGCDFRPPFRSHFQDAEMVEEAVDTALGHIQISGIQRPAAAKFAREMHDPFAQSRPSGDRRGRDPRLRPGQRRIHRLKRGESPRRDHGITAQIGIGTGKMAQRTAPRMQIQHRVT